MLQAIVRPLGDPGVDKLLSHNEPHGILANPLRGHIHLALPAVVMAPISFIFLSFIFRRFTFYPTHHRFADAASGKRMRLHPDGRGIGPSELSD